MNDSATDTSDSKIDTFFTKLRRFEVEERADNRTDWMNFDRRAEVAPIEQSKTE